MSNMTYSSNLRISAFLNVQRIKCEGKRNKKKKHIEKWYLIAATMRCGFTIKCRFPRGCVDKVILLRRRSGGKERRYQDEGNFVKTD